MLSTTLEELVEIFPQDWNIEIEEIEAVLHLIQQLDPIGMGHGPKRILVPSTVRLANRNPMLESGKKFGRELSTLIRQQRLYPSHKKAESKRDDDLKTAIALIKTLNPRPASKLNLGKVEYVEPDVLVVKKFDLESRTELKGNTSNSGKQ